MTWIVETKLGRHSAWKFYEVAPSRKLAYILASWPRAGGYRTRVRAAEPPGGAVLTLTTPPDLPESLWRLPWQK